MIGSCRRIKGRGEWREDSVRNGIWPKVREATWMGWDNKSSIPGNDGGKSFPVIASPLLSVLAVIRSPLIRRDIASSPRERYWKRIVTWDWYKYLKEPLLFVFSFFLFFFLLSRKSRTVSSGQFNVVHFKKDWEIDGQKELWKNLV